MRGSLLNLTGEPYDGKRRNIVKKRIAFFMALVITLSFAYVSLAAENKVIFDEQMMAENFEPDSFVQDVLYHDDIIYVLLQSSIYQYNIFSQKAKLLTVFLEGDGEETWFFSYEDAKEKLGEDADRLIHHLFYWNDLLYGINVLTGTAVAINPDSGKIQEDQKITGLWEERNEEDPSSYFDIGGVLNNKLFMKKEDYTSGDKKITVESIDLITGDKRVYQIRNVQKLLPYYDKGEFLAVIFDQANAYNYQTGKMNTPQLALFLPEEDKSVPLFNLTYYEAGGVALNSESNKVYYSSQGKVLEISEDEPEKVVGYGENPFVALDQKAWISNKGEYIIWKGWNDGIQIIPINEKASSVPVLSVYTGGENRVNKAFSKKHTDVPVVSISWETESYYNTDEIIKAIEDNTTKADVFIIQSSGMDIDRLIKEGLMLPLSLNESIKQHTERIYPYIRQVVQPLENGEIYAVPYQIDVLAKLSYFPQVWKEVGLSEEDIPKTYLEFIDFAKRWEQLQIEYPGYHFLAGQLFSKGQLLLLLVEEYENYFIKENIPLTFKTALFKELMEEAKKLDIPDRESDVDYLDDLEYENSLFEHYGSGILFNESDSWPLTLSLDGEKAPVVSVFSQFAFVNPNSPNQALAVDYLQGLVEDYSVEQQATLYVDANQPVKNENYETQITAFENALAEYQQEVVTAKKDEKEGLEGIINYYQKELNNKEKYYWLISPQRLEYYSEIIPYLFLDSSSPIYDDEEIIEIYYLVDDYMQDHLTVNQLINELELVVQKATGTNKMPN